MAAPVVTSAPAAVAPRMWLRLAPPPAAAAAPTPGGRQWRTTACACCHARCAWQCAATEACALAGCTGHRQPSTAQSPGKCPPLSNTACAPSARRSCAAASSASASCRLRPAASPLRPRLGVITSASGNSSLHQHAHGLLRNQSVATGGPPSPVQAPHGAAGRRRMASPPRAPRQANAACQS